MLIEEQIKKDIDLLAYFLTTCKKLTLDSYCMLITNSSAKFTFIHREPFLKRVRETCWKMAIIDLSKFYGLNKRNHHYSLSFFIADLITDHSTADWKNKISLQELEQILTDLDTDEVRLKVKKLIELRDQHYAHTDKDPDNNIYDIKFFYEDCIFLIKKAETIIQKLADSFNVNSRFAEYNGEEMNNFIDKYMQQALDAGRYRMSQTVT